MNELPDFWRTEIWHPLTVHFPLAILLLATIIILAGIFIKKKFFTETGYLLLFIGSIGAWIAIYTGNLADGIVSRQICDPTVLKNHEQNAYLVTWIFSGASLFVAIDYLGILKKLKKITSIVILLLALAGSGFLVYTGHLGAELVYQQAAGVYHPSEDCNEFLN